jgi:CheY-specific phosphatase CheX
MAIDLKGQLRLTQEKQARLRYQVRYQQRSLTRLREEVRQAVAELENGQSGAALTRLQEALAFNLDVDEDHTPPGATRKVQRQRAKQR